MTVEEMIRRFGDRAKLTERQSADYLQLEPSTLRNWRHKGIGPPFVKFGGSVRYEFGDLRQFNVRKTAA